VASLVGFRRNRIGDRLQAVIAYHVADFDVAYLRDDIRDPYTPQQFSGLVDSAGRVHEVFTPLREAETPAGSHSATVHAFEHSIVLQLLAYDEWGCAISMNPGIGRTVVSFVHDCRASLDDRRRTGTDRLQPRRTSIDDVGYAG